MRAKFGIDILDDALDGGLPRGTVTLLEEDTGLNPDEIISYYIIEGLKNGEYCYVLNTDHPPEKMQATLIKNGLNLEKYVSSGKLIFIDGFTSSFGWGEFESKCDFVIHNIADQKEVHEIIRSVENKISGRNNLRGVVDSLSTLMYASDDEKKFFNYVHHQMAAQKTFGNTLIFLVHKKLHKDEIIYSLEHIVDGVIELKKINVKHSWKTILQIQKLRGSTFSTKEFWYEIRENKLFVKPVTEYE